jgi:drug/metabolite transporter (DMT)-like permease
VPYLYLVPLPTGGMAVLFLDERVGAVKLIGAALVLAGVGLARRTTVIVPVPEPEEHDRAEIPIARRANVVRSAD